MGDSAVDPELHRSVTLNARSIPPRGVPRLNLPLTAGKHLLEEELHPRCDHLIGIRRLEELQTLISGGEAAKLVEEAKCPPEQLFGDHDPLDLVGVLIDLGAGPQRSDRSSPVR